MGCTEPLARWVEKISEWNPELSEGDCFAVVKSWFGIELPGIHSLADMDLVGFPEAFFSEIVHCGSPASLGRDRE